MVRSRKADWESLVAVKIEGGKLSDRIIVTCVAVLRISKFLRTRRYIRLSRIYFGSDLLHVYSRVLARLCI